MYLLCSGLWGRIAHVYSGPDKFVRVVKVKTATGVYNRPVHKLRRLPIEASPYINSLLSTFNNLFALPPVAPIRLPSVSVSGILIYLLNL